MPQTGTYAGEVVVEPTQDDLLGTEVHELDNVLVGLEKADELGVAVCEKGGWGSRRVCVRLKLLPLALYYSFCRLHACAPLLAPSCGRFLRAAAAMECEEHSYLGERARPTRPRSTCTQHTPRHTHAHPHTPEEVHVAHEVAPNELPDEAEDKVHVAVQQVLVTNVHQLAPECLGPCVLLLVGRSAH